MRTNTDFFEFRKTQGDIAAKTVFTGMIDEYFQYALGVLEYHQGAVRDRSAGYGKLSGKCCG